LILAVMLGEAGAVLINNVINSTNDRLLEAAILTITERIGVEEGEVTVDIPLAALGMLETGAQDSVYYGVYHDGAAVTGYPDLPIDDAVRQTPYRTVYWDGAYKGAAVRFAARMHWVYGEPKPVLIVVAETIRGRQLLRNRLLLALALLEAVLLAVLAALALLAVDRGLRPLATLGAEIDARRGSGSLTFTALDLSIVPREALSPARAFNALLRRLEETVGAIQRFTADASHQMRTPLAIMRTHLELARRHIGMPIMVGTALSELDGAAQRLDHMVSQLIALARADETAEDPGEAACDLGAVVTELVADRFPGTLEAGIELQVERPEEPILVRGSELLVRELTANLLDNAIRYSHSGGSVQVRLQPRSLTTEMEIEDTGPGIPPAERERVFERFYRIPTNRGPQGSGLGLAVVRTSCEKIGATVALEDRKDGPGLLVTVTFKSFNGETPKDAGAR
jgi:two-component system, OmpR family, sensor histidine kinase TctE